jgi:ankyrin repeat protein
LSGRTFNEVLSATPRSAIDQTDANVRSTLSWASQRGDDQAVAHLLRFGADPNKPDMGGCTPLHYSLFAATIKCMQHLLHFKADVEAKNITGATALHLAIGLEHGLQFVELLVAYGADVEAQENGCFTALHGASEANKPGHLSYLLSKGASINAETQMGHSAPSIAVMSNSRDALRILFKHPELHTNVFDVRGYNTATDAASYGDSETVRLLNEVCLSDVDINRPNWDGDTPLDIARWRRDRNVEWSRRSLRPLDDDPLAWFDAFMRLCDGIKSR